MRAVATRFIPTRPIGNPRLQLVQIGNSRVPVANANTVVNYAPRQAVLTMFNGAVFDFERYWPNPVLRGTFEHNGIYRCGGDYRCIEGLEETTGIQAAKSIYKPILFFLHADCPDPAGSDLQPGGCGKWLYAQGKVTATTNPFFVNMVLEEGIDFGVQGTLETPLIEASPVFWRYGPSLAQMPEDTRYIGRIEDTAPYADLIDPWYIPCGPPEQSETWRFWPRNLNSNLFGPTVQFEPGTWGTSQTLTPIIGETLRVYVDGNTLPRVKWLIRWDFSINYDVTVVNELGTRTYNYTYLGPVGYEELFDNWSETALVLRGGNVTYSLTSALGPVLTPGWNEINTGDQETVIGISHAWIN